MIRLDKFLADTGYGTRSEVKKLLKAGAVQIDGRIEKDPGFKLTAGKETVTVRGMEMKYREFYYYLLHKPAGVVTANSDTMHGTVMDYLEDTGRKDLFAVGRLDIDTEGLLIITNDGKLSHHLLSPAHHVEKTYFAVLDKPIPAAAEEAFRKGVDIGDEELTKPAKLRVLSNENGCYQAQLTITEGRFHQVKRMFAAVGCEVTYLKRIRMGSLELGELEKGSYRTLTEEEVEALKQA